eukprot:Pgem_evm1s6378
MVKGLSKEENELLDHIREVKHMLHVEKSVYEASKRIAALGGKSSDGQQVKQEMRMNLLEKSVVKYQKNNPELLDHLENASAFDNTSYLSVNGELVVKVISAGQLTPSQSKKVAPFCVVKLDNDTEAQTKPLSGAVLPLWDEEFDLKLNGKRTIEFALYSDKNTLSGVAFFHLEKLIQNNTQNLHLRVEPQGTINVELVFSRKGAIGRRDFVRRGALLVDKKQIDVKGHKFTWIQLAKNTKCAVCHRSLDRGSGAGYQCTGMLHYVNNFGMNNDFSNFFFG